jgi:putative endonuclease
MANGNIKNILRVGDLGEEVAAKYLENNGYKILERNYRVRNPFWKGEMDIIAEKDRAIVFAEIKTADNPKTDSFPAEERVDAKKKKKLIRLASFWLTEKRGKLNCKWQIDIIRVVIDRTAWRAKVRHYKNAVDDIR